MDKKTYWEIRDRIVNEMGTKQTINLVIDLLGNLNDLQDEVLEKYPFLKEDYDRLIDFTKNY